MKNLPSIFLFFIASAVFTLRVNAQNSSVAIGDATPKANAVLYLKSPGGNQGLIIPIVSSTSGFGEAGMIVYNSTDNKVYYNDGSSWIALGASAASGGTYSLSISGNTLSLDNTAGPSKTVSISSNTPGSANQFLMWDGSKWTATSFTQDISNANGAITVNGIKGKTLPTLPATTQALVYNGTAWVFQALPASTDSQDLTLAGTTLSLTNDATPVTLGALSILGSVSGGAAGTITDASIADVDISATAAIAGTKINPAFGTQNISTTGTATVGGGITAGASSQFTINGTGNITKINNVATSFPAAQGAANTVLTNNGSGTLSWTAPSSSWSLTGNSGTNPATNFIGTLDAQPLRLSTGVGGVERMRIDAAGNVGIGTTAPAAKLEVAGNILSTGLTVSSNTSNIYVGPAADPAPILIGIGGGTDKTNTAMGYSTLWANTGSSNTGLGYTAFYGNTTGSNNTGVGRDALVANTTGSNNTAIGISTLVSNITGSNNTALGSGANISTDGLINATAIGHNAVVGASNSLVLGGTGADAVSVGIGTTAPTRILDINSNGASYGMSHVDGLIRTSTYNGTLSGGGVGGSIGTESNHPFYIYVANSGEKATFLPNGNVGIGTNAPTVRLEVNGDIKTANNLVLTDGSFTYNTSVTASSYEVKYGGGSSLSINGFNTSLGKGFVGAGTRLAVGNSGDGSVAVANSWTLYSDARLKKNVSTYTDALTTVNKLRGVKFEWIRTGASDIGFIAQEVEKVIPEIVFNNEESGYKSVSYEKVVAVLVEAIKEQQQKIEDLEIKLKEAELQKTEIAQMKSEILEIRKALSLEASVKKK